METQSHSKHKNRFNVKTPAQDSSNPAVAFLKAHGHTSIVSMGCGRWINRIDNHLRLMVGLNLNYYVGIDYQSHIEPISADMFMDPDHTIAMLTSYYRGRLEMFWETVKLFPKTSVEELAGIHCAAVVCQRLFPDCRWEEIIISMSPKLVLQEDLHGCERQRLRSKQYVRTWSKIHEYGLRPFRPWSIFPGEKNLVLWRHRDFACEQGSGGKFRWLERLAETLIG